MKLTEAQLWEKLENLRWGNDFNYKRIKRELDAMPRDEFRQLDDFAHDRQRFLMAEIQDWEETYGQLELGSDDSFNDLTAHIVGMGKAEFDRVLENPRLAEERARAEYGTYEGYKENFLYAFLPSHLVFQILYSRLET